jgi:adenylate kinase family enzyme
MTSEAFVFVGRSGCGKGTQATLLKEQLEKEGRRVLYVETGDIFRTFIQQDSFSGKKSFSLYETAVRQPDFLACYMWTKVLLDSYSLGTDVIFDGTPRSLSEAKVLETCFSFFEFKKVHVIHLDVSRPWSERHLISRGRSDDINMEKIARRLDWYEKDVVPALKYYKESPAVNFLQISGERSVEEVHADIKKNVLAEQ